MRTAGVHDDDIVLAIIVKLVDKSTELIERVVDRVVGEHLPLRLHANMDRHEMTVAMHRNQRRTGLSSDTEDKGHELDQQIKIAFVKT